MLLASGENPEWVARVLGHSSTEMLFKVYSRYIPNLTRMDGSAFERLLGAQLPTAQSLEEEITSELFNNAVEAHMNDGYEESRIELFTLGEMRMLGIEIPPQFADSADDNMLVLPRSAALELATRCLKRWKVPDEDGEVFLADITDDVIHDVLVSHQFLRLLIRNADPDRFFQNPHPQFDDRTPWDLIRSGESDQIRKFLAHQVFCGGW